MMLTRLSHTIRRIFRRSHEPTPFQREMRQAAEFGERQAEASIKAIERTPKPNAIEAAYLRSLKPREASHGRSQH